MIGPMGETPPPTNAPESARWRIQAKDGDRIIALENEGMFDELVIDQWLHLEQMDDDRWWLRIGDVTMSGTIDADGNAKATVDPQ